MATFVTVPTAAGLVRGLDSCGVTRFLAVPYGESTGGQRRFRPPVPKEPWTGVLDALEFGPVAPQNDFRIGGSSRGDRMIGSLNPRGGSPTEAGPTSEDCLSLNIWAPSENGRSRPVPVMVWLHGGAYLTGSGNETAFHADVLAERENVVVVAVNHRLGLLGFCPWEDYDPTGYAGAGVAGMLDIVLALEWVRDNIAAFGGDPGNVTVFGQSGGGAKTANLLAMPNARGLFHKIIMQSPSSPSLPLKEDHSRIAALAAEELGIDAGNLERLAELPVGQILQAQRTVEQLVDPGRVLFSRGRPQLRIGPYRDGVHIAGDFYSADIQPWAAGIPAIVGSAAHEYSMKLCSRDDYPDATDELVAAELAAELGDQAAAIVADYAARHDEPPRLRWARICADISFRGVAIRTADHLAACGLTVFEYVFNQPTDILDGMLGSCHSLDLAYTFGTVDRIPMTGRVPGRHQVSEHIMDAWARFARTGDPNGGSLPAWPAWSPAEARLLLMETAPAIVSAVDYAPLATERGAMAILP
ncbi:MAG: carboxylesterase/lipase family protein [Propionibacteriaceae bacterium]|nr:carboxylesterase/lipase family protein [Propionibacteriaceae bacterium]